MAAPPPTSHYLVVPPSDIPKTKPLIRLLLNQIGLPSNREEHEKTSPIHTMVMGWWS